MQERLEAEIDRLTTSLHQQTQALEEARAKIAEQEENARLNSSTGPLHKLNGKASCYMYTLHTVAVCAVQPISQSSKIAVNTLWLYTQVASNCRRMGMVSYSTNLRYSHRAFGVMMNNETAAKPHSALSCA